MSVKPYYQDEAVTIYHGDARDIGQIPADALVADPPYGIDYKSNHNSSRIGWMKKWVRDTNFDPIYGDDEPFDPAPWLVYPKMVLWGANYYCSRLPDASCWLIWDKREGMTSDNQADCELAWTNLAGPPRLFRHLWRGIMRRGEENVSRSPKLHPHQKPLGLMRWVLQHCELELGALIYDPFMGSGSTLRAAKDLGFRAVGVEKSEAFCETAAKRMGQLPMQLAYQTVQEG